MWKKAGWMGIVFMAAYRGEFALAADWGPLDNQGAPVAYLAQPAVAWVSPSRAVLVGTRDDAGTMRLGAAAFDGGVWSPLIAGGTVDEGSSVAHRLPRLAADGAGHAVLLYGRFEESVWRLQARWFDGSVFSPLAGGVPVDQDAGGNTCAFSGAFVSPAKLVAAYTKDDGSRMALFVRSWNGGGWQDENGGVPLDDPMGLGADAPAIAGDGAGGALVVFAQYGAAGPRLSAMHLDSGGWHQVNGGTPLDRADLGGVSSPAVASLGGGRWLVAYVQEDADGESQRLYAVEWTGAAWERVHEGQPLDGSPKGVRAAAAATDGMGSVMISYITEDFAAGVEPPGVRALRVTGLSASPMNGGEALEAPGSSAIPSLALGTCGSPGACGALLVMHGQSGGVDRVYARDILPPAAPAAAGTAASAEAGRGLRVTHNLFQPARGEQVRIVCDVPEFQRVRVAVYSLAGSAVRLVAAGGMAGRMEWAWDGRDDSGRAVSAGIYLLVADTGSSRETRKLVVVR